MAQNNAKSTKYIDPSSKQDCELLLDRILATLQSVKPAVILQIERRPPLFREDDCFIFEGLCRAIFTIQSKYKFIEPELKNIKSCLCNYNFDRLAILTDDKLSVGAFSKIPSGIKWSRKLVWIRDNARTFQTICKEHGSVWSFVKSRGHGVREEFVSRESLHHLSGVGPAICSEFFNNIGIDDFKPDVHAIRFFGRILVKSVSKPLNPTKARRLGIQIATALDETRKYVDSAIWNFCADGRGEICTKQQPKCGQCLLNVQEPIICLGV